MTESKKVSFIDGGFLQVENALLDLRGNIRVVNLDDGTIENMKLTTDMKYLYIQLTKYINWRKIDDQMVERRSVRNLAKCLDWSDQKVQKNLKLLQHTGLIMKERGNRGGNLYTINSLKHSWIDYLETDKNGEYVHQEIIYYIKDRLKEQEERQQKQKKNPFQSHSPKKEKEKKRAKLINHSHEDDYDIPLDIKKTI